MLGAVALGAAARELERIGWQAIRAHDDALATALRQGLASIPGVRVLGPPPDVATLPIATFTVEGIPHSLLAARLSAEHAIGVRHGCFCAHPYLVRLLGLSPTQLDDFRAAARGHDRHALPGAVRASAGISTTTSDVQRLLDAVAAVASTPPPVPYASDPITGDYWPPNLPRPDAQLGPATGCARG